MLDEILDEAWAVRSVSYYSCDEAEVVLTKPKPGRRPGTVRLVPAEPVIGPSDDSHYKPMGMHTRRFLAGGSILAGTAIAMGLIVFFPYVIAAAAVIGGAYFMGYVLLPGEQDSEDWDPYFPTGRIDIDIDID